MEVLYWWIFNGWKNLSLHCLSNWGLVIALCLVANWEIFVFIVGNEKIFVDCSEDLLKIEHTCLPLRPNHHHHHHHSWDRSNPKLRFCNILWNPFYQLVSGPGLQWGADALPFWCSSNLKFKQVSKWICSKCGGNSSKTSHFNPPSFPPFCVFPHVWCVSSHLYCIFLTPVVFFPLLLCFFPLMLCFPLLHNSGRKNTT